MCEDCSRNGTDYCDDCIPYDSLCCLFLPKSADAASEPASDVGSVSYSSIYEHIMTETESSHFWAVKSE